jgi:hypothetical protein
MILIELKTANNATPVSAKTAPHMVAIPSAPKTKTINLIPNANVMF